MDVRRFISPILAGQTLIDRKTTLVWPVQCNPTSADWSIWAGSFHLLNHGNILICLIDMAQCTIHQKWFWYMDSNQALFHSTRDLWSTFAPVLSRTRSLCSTTNQYKQSQAQLCQSPSRPLAPASVYLISPDVLQAIPLNASIRSVETQLQNMVSAASLDLMTSLHTQPFYSYLYRNLNLTTAGSWTSVSPSARYFNRLLRWLIRSGDKSCLLWYGIWRCGAPYPAFLWPLSRSSRSSVGHESWTEWFSSLCFPPQFHL